MFICYRRNQRTFKTVSKATVVTCSGYLCNWYGSLCVWISFTKIFRLVDLAVECPEIGYLDYFLFSLWIDFCSHDPAISHCCLCSFSSFWCLVWLSWKTMIVQPLPISDMFYTPNFTMCWHVNIVLEFESM